MNFIPLRAGPLSLAFDRAEGSIRYVFAGSNEVLRGISAPVRDAQWLTIRPQVTALEVDQRDDGFRVSFQACCRSDAVDFEWRGIITGDKEGTLAFDFDGEARREFARNRIGFCVLHPAEAAGRPLVVEHTDGARDAACFPEAIAPHQPFFDIRMLAHEFAPGCRAEVRLEGDTFEMEDQRNWTDASFKTYCTPLALPRPVTLAAGVRIRQRVTMRLLDARPAEASPFTPPWKAPYEVRLAVVAAKGATQPEAAGARHAHERILPALGTLWRGSPVPQVIAALRLLRLAHLRIDLWLGGAGWRDDLRDGASAAVLLDAALEVAAFVSDAAQTQLLELRDALGTLSPAPRIARWIIFHERQPSTPPGCIAVWREIFATTPYAAPVGGGATDNFTELNRGREIAGVADFTVHACNPQVHVFDNLSIVETLAIQGATVVAARSMSGGHPTVISPITLAPRCTSGTGDSDGDVPADLLPFRVDERLATPFAAAWMLGSLAVLATAGAASLTYFEACGANGLVEADGTPRPVSRLLELLAPFAGVRVHGIVSDPTRVAALALEPGDRRMLISATYHDLEQRVQVTGAWGEQELVIGPQPSLWNVDRAGRWSRSSWRSK